MAQSKAVEKHTIYFYVLRIHYSEIRNDFEVLMSNYKIIVNNFSQMRSHTRLRASVANMCGQPHAQ